MNELEPRGPAAPEHRHDEIMLFLGNETEKLRAGGANSYDLVSEYRKTKANRQPIIPIVIVVITVVVLGVSLLITRVIDTQSRKVAVDIQSFEDLNLQDLLDMAKRNMDDLDKASLELATLQSSLRTDLNKIADQKRADLALADAMKLDPEALAKRHRDIEGDASAKIKAANEKYGPQIKTKEQEVSALQSKIAAYDSGSLEKARKQQAELDNQRQVFEHEQQQLKDFYEKRIAELQASLEAEKAENERRQKAMIAELTSRYNPTWTEERALALAAAGEAAKSRPANPKFPAEAPRGSPIATDAIRSTATRYDDLRYLIGRLRGVQYLNSVPGTLAAMDEAGADLAADFTSLLQTVSTNAVTRDQRILRLESALVETRSSVDSYDYALAGYASFASESGIIIDPREKTRVVVYIDPLYHISGEGAAAWVFRADDEPIAELTLRREGEKTFASVDRIEEGQEIRPFDRILIKSSSRSEVTP
jgi:hypothetical protein